MFKSNRIFRIVSVVLIVLASVVAIYSEATKPKIEPPKNEMVANVEVLSIDWGSGGGQVASDETLPVHFKRDDNGESFTVFIPRWQMTIWNKERCQVKLRFSEGPTELVYSKELK